MKLSKSQKKWIKALRSGKYKKGTGNLHMKHDNQEDTYCCLGVACDIFKDELNIEAVIKGRFVAYDGEDAGLTRIIRNHLNLLSTLGDSLNLRSLADINDGIYRKDTDFTNMADHIEKYAEEYFIKGE